MTGTELAVGGEAGAVCIELADTVSRLFLALGRPVVIK